MIQRVFGSVSTSADFIETLKTTIGVSKTE